MPIPAGSRYVAMGSSFAAGPGLPSRVPGSPRRAGRSTGNYAHLDAVTPETSLATITAGGNGVGFAPRLTLASLPWPLRALPSVKARVDALAETRATDQRFEQLERNFAMIAARLRDRAPACRVVIVDYLTVLPRTAPPRNRRRRPRS